MFGAGEGEKITTTTTAISNAVSIFSIIVIDGPQKFSFNYQWQIDPIRAIHFIVYSLSPSPCLHSLAQPIHQNELPIPAHCCRTAPDPFEAKPNAPVKLSFHYSSVADVNHPFVHQWTMCGSKPTAIRR